MKRVLVIGLIALACTDPEARARAAEARALEDERPLAVQRVLLAERALSLLADEHGVTTAEAAALRSDVLSYMARHKLAVAALAAGAGGAGVAFDQSNTFSSEAKQTAAVVAGVAAIYALGNAAEVAAVGTTLWDADRRLDALYARADSLGTLWQERQAEAGAHRARLDSMVARLAEIRR